MNVFVTGGTGVLGRAAIRELLDRGHTVVALAHSDSAAGKLEQPGVTVVRGSLFDGASMMRAVAGSDAVMHLATRIPPSSKMGKASAWAENDRIRAEGTRNLVDAAIEHGAQVFVYPSVGFFYEDGGDRWIDANTGGQRPASFLRSTLEAEAQVERFTSSGGRGVVVRLGWVYGPESMHTQESLAYARKGIAAILGSGDAYQSWIWEQDASEALVMALEHAPAGTYDVTDDRPVTRTELIEAMAGGVGRKTLRKLPGFMVRMFTGKEASEMGGRSHRVSNRRFKEATGWTPTVPTVHDGWRRLGA